jgi:hypothetical protein
VVSVFGYDAVAVDVALLSDPLTLLELVQQNLVRRRFCCQQKAGSFSPTSFYPILLRSTILWVVGFSSHLISDGTRLWLSQASYRCEALDFSAVSSILVVPVSNLAAGSAAYRIPDSQSDSQTFGERVACEPCVGYWFVSDACSDHCLSLPFHQTILD